MLNSFSKLHHMGLSNVKLEINNQYPSEQDLVEAKDEIKDLTLQATVCRNSPYKRGAKSRSNPSDSDNVTDPQIHNDGSPRDVKLSQTEVDQTFKTFHGNSLENRISDDSNN
jgi:hypothetical protein